LWTLLITAAAKQNRPLFRRSAKGGLHRRETFRERPDRLDQRYPALGFFLDELDLVAALAGLEVDAQLTSLPSSS
jgi:hypothetical protein